MAAVHTHCHSSFQNAQDLTHDSVSAYPPWLPRQSRTGFGGLVEEKYEYKTLSHNITTGSPLSFLTNRLMHLSQAVSSWSKQLSELCTPPAIRHLGNFLINISGKYAVVIKRHLDAEWPSIGNLRWVPQQRLLLPVPSAFSTSHAFRCSPVVTCCCPCRTALATFRETHAHRTLESG